MHVVIVAFIYEHFLFVQFYMFVLLIIHLVIDRSNC